MDKYKMKHMLWTSFTFLCKIRYLNDEICQAEQNTRKMRKFSTDDNVLFH